MRLAAPLLLVLFLLPSPVFAADPIEGTASTWSGPGAATNDCHYPWTSCTPRKVQSLKTGVMIIVTPTMFCDCFTGMVGPNGEKERLIDLDPAMVRALGLDPAAGLFDVAVTLLDSGLPDTATES